jgi:hypothetical protein
LKGKKEVSDIGRIQLAEEDLDRSGGNFQQTTSGMYAFVMKNRVHQKKNSAYPALRNGEPLLPFMDTGVIVLTISRENEGKAHTNAILTRGHVGHIPGLCLYS